jgi:hypothetical protein
LTVNFRLWRKRSAAWRTLQKSFGGLLFREKEYAGACFVLWIYNAENAKNQKYKCLVRLKKIFFAQYKNGNGNG